MSVQDLCIAVLLSVGVAITLLSCLGVAIMRGPFDRLHFLGPVNSLGAILLAAAIVVKNPVSNSALKAVFVAAVLLLVGPVLSHATARAIHIRAGGAAREQPPGVEPPRTPDGQDDSSPAEDEDPSSGKDNAEPAR